MSGREPPHPGDASVLTPPPLLSRLLRVTSYGFTITPQKLTTWHNLYALSSKSCAGYVCCFYDITGTQWGSIASLLSDNNSSRYRQLELPIRKEIFSRCRKEILSTASHSSWDRRKAMLNASLLSAKKVYLSWYRYLVRTEASNSAADSHKNGNQDGSAQNSV